MQQGGSYGGGYAQPPQPPQMPYPQGQRGAPTAGGGQQDFGNPTKMAGGQPQQSGSTVYLQPGAAKTLSADDGEEVKILPLGSGGEVGRSCVICSYRGKNVMFDCGVHPAKSGLDALPLFDNVATWLDSIDVVLITHFHLDHCAALPYLLAQTNFRGKVYMTSATKAFYKVVLADFARVGSMSDLVTPEWIDASLESIETIEYHQEKAWNGIRFQPFNAGHVLGAAMFQVDIAGVKILYTGDYSSVPDRHLMGAEVPAVSPDILIVESTYGIQVLGSREEREEKFLRHVTTIVEKGGRCLIPVFALGRAQELLLILEEHWRAHEELQHVKVLYASNMAQKCMKLYQRYVHSMNDRVKRQQEETSTNPFDFKFVQPLTNLSSFQDSGPAVVIAAPGMLQNGISLELFERWAGDRRNGIIFAGYCVEGTTAKDVMSKPKQVTIDGRVVNVKMSTIETVSFSAHSDARQTGEFIKQLGEVTNVVLVHGNEKAGKALASKLTEDFKPTRNMTVHETKNLITIKVKFNMQRTAKVLGSLAALTTRPELGGAAQGQDGDAAPTREVPEGQYVSGILLISKDHNHIIVHPDEVTTFTGLQHSTVTQALVLPLPMHKPTADVLDWLKLYFADSASYNSFGVAKQGEQQSESKPATLLTAPTEDGEDVLLVGAGLGGPMAGQSAVMETGPGAPRGVLVKLRTDPNTAHTTATIVWRTSRLTDLIADVTSIALCRLITEHNAQPEEDDEDEEDAVPEGDDAARGGKVATAKTNVKGIEDRVTLPVEVAAQGIDPYFKSKCFHQMLSQFFPVVRTNLLNGDCHIQCSNGERVEVRNFCEIFSEESDHTNAAGGQEKEGHINGVSSSNFNSIAQILKRVYMTLFPVPADYGWCECGQQHGDSHIVHEQHADYEKQQTEEE